MRACIDQATRLSESVCSNQQVHDAGLDARAVQQRAGHLGGEARTGLGVTARAVLDFGVGVAHDLLEHDVDEGTPLVAGAGGVGEVCAAAHAGIDGEHSDALAGAGVGARCIRIQMER